VGWPFWSQLEKRAASQNEKYVTGLLAKPDLTA